MKAKNHTPRRVLALALAILMALTTATAKVDETAGQIADLAEAAMQQIKQLQLAISGSKQILRDTATTLYAIRPEDEE